MKYAYTVLALASAYLLLAAESANAVQTVVVNVNCSSTVRLQKRIDSLAAGRIGVFNISGACNENIVIPQGKTVLIKGVSAGASIVAANPSVTTLSSKGDTTLQNMKVVNAGGSADVLVETDRGGSLDIVASDLSAPNVSAVVGAYLGPVRVINSRIVGGRGNAIEVWGASTTVVKGDTSFPAGPTGARETLIRSPGSGIQCSQGGSLRIVTNTGNSLQGRVTIEQSQVGIDATQCDVAIINNTESTENIRIRNNVVGLRFAQARGSIYGTNIDNNAQYGVDLLQSDMDVSSSSIIENGFGVAGSQSRLMLEGVTLDNSSGEINADKMTSIDFRNGNIQSSMPKALSASSSISCQNGGRIDIDAGALNPDIGNAYDGLGCVYVH